MSARNGGKSKGVGWRAYKKNKQDRNAKRSWTSAPSRGKKEFTPEEAAALRLELKNYLIRRRLVVSRLGEHAEANQINRFLDFLRKE